MKISNDHSLLPQSMLPQKAIHDSQNAFSNLLNENLNATKAKGIERQDEIGEILRRSQGRDAYADEFMMGFMNDLGGPLIDVSDPNAIRFSNTGELVTDEAMKYYAEIKQMAKNGYRDIYFAGKAQGADSMETFEKFLEFNSTLPMRYKQMANIWF